MLHHLFERAFTVFFFVVLFAIGILIYRDYGLSWDEGMSHRLGLLTYNYITKQDTALLTFGDKDCGPVFETALLAIERLVEPTGNNTQIIYLTRHLVVFLVFFISIIFFYFLCKRIFNHRLLALLGCLMLVVCPRIFAHAFFNSKDIPFLSLMIIAAWAAMRFLDKPNFLRVALLSFFSALAIDIRMAGLLVVVFTAVIYIFQLMVLPERRSLKYVGLFIAYGALTFVFMVLMWPSMWPDPLGNFISFLKSASNYRWSGSVLFEGRWFFPARKELPWDYLPSWILFTVPISYLFFFAVGCLRACYQLLINFKESAIKSGVLFALMWFFIPFALVICLKSTIYNGWRHLFFIYPPLVILALLGFQYLIDKGKWLRVLSCVLICIDLIGVVTYMIKAHPHEHAYFNVLPGKNLEAISKRYQLDLWLVEYKPALDYILKVDKKDKIKVYFSTADGRLASGILPLDQQKRIVHASNPKDADYKILDFYFFHDRKDLSAFGQEVFALTVNGSKVLWIYK